MSCDTTGIEPDFALVKFKKLAGGGYFKIINRTVPLARAQDAGLNSTDNFVDTVLDSFGVPMNNYPNTVSILYSQEEYIDF